MIVKKRHLYMVQPTGDPDGMPWKVTRDGEIRSLCWTQADAIKDAALICRSRLKNFGDLSELKICRPNGEIRDSRTYGKDPRKVPG